MSEELYPQRVKKPLSTASIFFIGWMIAWVEMLICFGTTAFGLIALKPVAPGTVPHTTTFSGMLGLGGAIFCLSLLVSLVSAIALLPLKRLSFKRLVWPITVMVLVFCLSYIVVDLWMGSPQQALLDAVTASIQSDGFALSKGLARDLGWLSIPLFFLFIFTGLLDLLWLPFVPLFNHAVQVQAFVLMGYGVVMLIVSAIPAGLTGLWLAKQEPADFDESAVLD